MCVKLLTENHLEYISLKGDCTGSSESTLIKMPRCWKSHYTAQMQNYQSSCWGRASWLLSLTVVVCVCVSSSWDRLQSKPPFGIGWLSAHQRNAIQILDSVFYWLNRIFIQLIWKSEISDCKNARSINNIYEPLKSYPYQSFTSKFSIKSALHMLRSNCLNQ